MQQCTPILWGLGEVVQIKQTTLLIAFIRNCRWISKFVIYLILHGFTLINKVRKGMKWRCKHATYKWNKVTKTWKCESHGWLSPNFHLVLFYNVLLDTLFIAQIPSNITKTSNFKTRTIHSYIDYRQVESTLKKTVWVFKHLYLLNLE